MFIKYFLIVLKYFLIVKQHLQAEYKPEAQMQCILYNATVKDCFSVLVCICT